MTDQNLSSAALRSKIADIESAASGARARLVSAEAENQTALREAITESGPFGIDRSPVTESLLADARADYLRAKTSLDVANQLLAEAITREAAAARDAARADVEDRIAEITALADQADTAFATAIGLLRKIHAKEGETHRVIRDATGQPPWTSPQALTAAVSVANDLRTLANGNTPRPRAWVRNIADSSAHSLRESVR